MSIPWIKMGSLVLNRNWKKHWLEISIPCNIILFLTGINKYYDRLATRFELSNRDVRQNWNRNFYKASPESCRVSRIPDISLFIYFFKWKPFLKCFYLMVGLYLALLTKTVIKIYLYVGRIFYFSIKYFTSWWTQEQNIQMEGNLKSLNQKVLALILRIKS